jgi:hypothetical protein
MVNKDDILSLFHHIHHLNNKHEVHHCGGKHSAIDPELDYEIKHCKCNKHSINKEVAIGHSVDTNLESVEIKIKFLEQCPDGGWHIESGVKLKGEEKI